MIRFFRNAIIDFVTDFLKKNNDNVIALVCKIKEIENRRAEIFVKNLLKKTGDRDKEEVIREIIHYFQKEKDIYSGNYRKDFNYVWGDGFQIITSEPDYVDFCCRITFSDIKGSCLIDMRMCEEIRDLSKLEAVKYLKKNVNHNYLPNSFFDYVEEQSNAEN